MFEFFSEEQKLVRKTIHAFVEDTIAPFAKQWDEQDTCPQELWPKMAALGMIGSFIPESEGGVGFGLTERTIMIEEIARHSAGLAIAFMTNDITIAIIQDFASQELKDLYLPALLKGEKIGSFAVTEWTGGSDFSNQSSTITARDDHYLVSGQKCFVTNARFADFAIITGVEGTEANGRNIISAVLVPAEDEGFTWGRVEHKIGMKSSTTGT